MGMIIGKFRKKKSTYEVLEKLENQITSIEEFGRSTEQFRKKIIGRFLLLAVLLYFILSICLFYYYDKISSDRRFIYIIPVVAFPIIIWIIKKSMMWYYSRKIQRNEKKLVKLRDEKKKILDNVMETETYKVAKKILDKFGNEPTKVPQLALSGATPITSKDMSMVPSTLRPNQTGLRQRIERPQPVRGRLSYGPPTPYPERTFIQPAMSSARPSIQYQATPIPTLGAQATPVALLGAQGTPARMPGTLMPLPRSILPKDPSVLDKMIHYLIGDGPSNRYALICQQCSNHNGMAFKEDFEYLSFRCCYCSHFNPSRKQRPTGPKLESSSSTTKTTADSTSDSDKDTVESDDEVVSEPITSEPRADSPDTERNSDFDKLSDIDPGEMEADIRRQDIQLAEVTEFLQGGAGDRGQSVQDLNPLIVDESHSTPDPNPSAVDDSHSTPDPNPSAVDESHSTPVLNPSAVDESHSTPVLNPSAVDESHSTPDLNPFDMDGDESNPDLNPFDMDVGSADSPMEIDAKDSPVKSPTENLSEA